MNQQLRDIVTALATEVRWWAESRAETESLAGWCAKASARLFNELVRAGIQAEIHLWTWNRDDSAHVYIVVDDHIVDVTATQFAEFRNVPVLIMHQREAEVHEFYRTKEVFRSVMELIRSQKKHRWPANQIAYTR